MFQRGSLTRESSSQLTRILDERIPMKKDPRWLNSSYRITNKIRCTRGCCETLKPSLRGLFDQNTKRSYILPSLLGVADVLGSVTSSSRLHGFTWNDRRVNKRIVFTAVRGYEHTRQVSKFMPTHGKAVERSALLLSRVRRNCL
jgi:hypothetical protein